MTSTGTSKNPLRVLPVAFALLFNVIAPVATIAVPTSSPIGATAPKVAAAASDPEGVTFTIEGCRNPSVNLEDTDFLCADADYTTGNLGKTWNELDLVPHRLTTSLKTGTTTYTVGITADHMEGTPPYPGYDVMSPPVLNAAKSDSSCKISVGAQQVLDPGIGGTDQSLGRLVTITQDPNTTCVFDWVERLALGSHLFPGSSLHTNLTNQAWGTQGIGAKDVSIPVKEILPQELSKDMSATQGQAYAWSISKSASPTSLSFENTCLTATGARSQTVQITVSWTRTGPNAAGDTTITTNIYATNPAHRTITVNATDKIYEGAGQTNELDSFNTGDVNVPAGSTDLKIGTHTFVYSGNATTFNDVATASYKDLETGIRVPGNTTATASATTKPASGDAANATAVISDSEDINGTGLAFSVAAPSLGAFTGGYTAGTSTSDPVGWSYTASGSGSVTFTKTVTVDQARQTSGTLYDTATVKSIAGDDLASANASVAITSDAEVSLTINKSIPAGSLRSGESVTFDFTISGPNDYSDTALITFSYGDSTTKSVTLSGLEPGSYTVSESPKAGWADQADKTVDIGLPVCAGSVTFNNTELAPNLSASKTADDETVTAGDQIGFVITVSNSAAAGTGTAKDVTINDPLPGGDGIDWSIASGPAGCTITGSVPNEVLSCNLGDIAPGASVSVHVVSGTTLDSCGQYENTATIDASNADPITRKASATVNCPDVSVLKTTSTPVVNAGDTVRYSITVTAGGTGDSTNVTLTDTLPAGIDWSEDSDDCSIAGGVLSCSWSTLSPGDAPTVNLTGTAGPEDCGTLSNTATVDSDVDVNGQNDSSGPVQISVNCPDVSVQKTGSSVVSAGDAIHYTITASNTGDGDAYGFTLTDTLPAVSGGWTLADDAPDFCSLAGNSLTCSPSAFEAGDSFSVTLNATSSNADCGELENTAHVSATNEPQQSMGDNQSSWTIGVDCPNLTVEKSADSGTISAGDLAEYTITVTNEGPGTAYDTHLEENVPDGLNWSIDSVTGADPTSCASSVSSEQPQSISCDFGSLDEGASVTIHLSAETTAADCGTLHNVATVSGSNEDPEALDDNEASADIVVECPGLNVAKDAVDDTIVGGETAAFSIVVWNAGPGTAHNVTLSDELPAGLSWTENSDDCSISGGVLSCSFGDLGVSSMADSTARVTVSAETTRAACGTLENTAIASADNNDDVDDDATIAVHCPTVAIEKTNDQTESVLPGTVVTYTLQVTVGDGPAASVKVVDTLPEGLDAPTNISDGGSWDATARTITWNLGDLATGEHSLSYQAAVSSDVENGQVLKNVVVVTSPDSQCPDAETLGPECKDDSVVTPRVPTLVIDKAADTDTVHFHFDADGNLLTVTPEQVTWTLTWTLSNGPVTNAVISDPLPEFLTYVDGSASDGGSYDSATRTLSWTFASLTDAAGSVTFQTTVDPDAPETGPIENVATIDSDQTAPDEGVDSIRVTSDSEQAETGTPQPSLPNTALGTSPSGQPLNVPIWLVLLVFIGSLGSLAGVGAVNLVAVRRRR